MRKLITKKVRKLNGKRKDERKINEETDENYLQKKTRKLKENRKRWEKEDEADRLKLMTNKV